MAMPNEQTATKKKNQHELIRIKTEKKKNINE